MKTNGYIYLHGPRQTGRRRRGGGETQKETPKILRFSSVQFKMVSNHYYHIYWRLIAPSTAQGHRRAFHLFEPYSYLTAQVSPLCDLLSQKGPYVGFITFRRCWFSKKKNHKTQLNLMLNQSNILKGKHCSGQLKQDSQSSGRHSAFFACSSYRPQRLKTLFFVRTKHGLHPISWKFCFGPIWAFGTGPNVGMTDKGPVSSCRPLLGMG